MYAVARLKLADSWNSYNFPDGDDHDDDNLHKEIDNGMCHELSGDDDMGEGQYYEDHIDNGRRQRLSAVEARVEARNMALSIHIVAQVLAAWWKLAETVYLRKQYDVMELERDRIFIFLLWCRRELLGSRCGGAGIQVSWGGATGSSWSLVFLVAVKCLDFRAFLTLWRTVDKCV